MTFLCNADPEYGWQKKVKALEPHQFRQWWNAAPSLRQVVAKKKSPFGDGGEEMDPNSVNQANFPESMYFNGGLLMDEDEVAAWADVGIELRISRVKGLRSNARELAQTIFQVSVANVGLMQIRCAEQLEDCCTDELNRYLDRGWRILAVCPANDTRRPTYIVGHIDQEPHR